MEQFEPRVLPDASIAGTVFQALDTVDPNNKAPDPGPPVAGVRVVLDHVPAIVQTTDANGNYTFTNVAAGPHSVSIALPAGFWSFSAQSLSYNLTVGTQPFANLNFALTSQTQALVQNLYQRVVIRSSDVGGLQYWTKALNTGTAAGGQVLASFVATPEFQSLVTPIANVLAGFFPGEPINADLLRNNIQIARTGITPDANVLNILYSQPFLARYGDTSLLTDTQFVTFLYNTLLHRAPDPNGLANWVNLLSMANAPLNRGQVALDFTTSPEFFQRNPAVGNEAAVSMAYLGLLGRSADQGGFTYWVNTLNAGTSITQMGNAFVASSEFAGLTGFNDVFLSDIQSYPIEAPVSPLNRLQMYDPSKSTFDLPVTTLSGQTSSGPANVYVISHGWAPGFAEDVLLHSTPGKPLHWWDTVQFPGGLTPPSPDSPWMFQGVDKVSVEGLAQAIVDADPHAQVIAFSWIDDSGTPGTGAFSLQNAAGLEGDVPFISQSEANTQLNGVRMAEAIKAALGPQFFTNQGLLHLLGHSHGTRVATVAALTLQKENIPVTQLTTFESPEFGPIGANVTGEVNARNFLWYYLQQMDITRSPLVANSRTPATGTFVDNYWAGLGVGMPFAGFPGLGSVVDVNMNAAPIYGFDPVGAHSYPPPWYGQASLANPLSPVSTTMAAPGITSSAPNATVTVNSTTGFPSSGQDGFFIQIDNEIMQETSGAGTTAWTLGGRGLFGTTPATHTNLASPVILLQNNALQWSPLINPSVTPLLSNGYAQAWTSFNFNQQFLLNPNPGSGITPPAPVPLQYANQYQIGTVTDTGSSITLSTDASHPLALDALTFTPISQSVAGQSGKRGSGLGFQFQFTNPGEGDRLVVWERGLFGLSAPNLPTGAIDTGTLGYRTVPLFVMTGQDAGSAPQTAILNLDAFFNNLSVSPLALGMFHGTQLPQFGFSLIHAGGSTSTVTVMNLQQLNDGTGP